MGSLLSLDWAKVGTHLPSSLTPSQDPQRCLWMPCPVGTPAGPVLFSLLRLGLLGWAVSEAPQHHRPSMAWGWAWAWGLPHTHLANTHTHTRPHARTLFSPCYHWVLLPSCPSNKGQIKWFPKGRINEETAYLEPSYQCSLLSSWPQQVHRKTQAQVALSGPKTLYPPRPREVGAWPQAFPT